MTYNLQGIVNKVLKSRKGLLVSTIASLILGITIVLTLSSLSTQSEEILLSDIQKQYGNMDLYIEFETQVNNQDIQRMNDFLYKREDVKEIEVAFVGQYQVNSNINTYTVGVENGNLSKSRYKFNENISENQCIINQSLADALNVEIGDKVVVQNTELSIIEILKDIKDTSSVPDVLLVNSKNIDRFTFKPYIMIDAVSVSDLLKLTVDIKQYDTSLLVYNLFDDSQISAVLSSTKSFLSFLSIISVIMCACIVISNLQLFLFSFSKQLNLLRIIGMNRNQVFLFLLRVGTTMNIVGTSIAFISYLLSYRLIEKWMGHIIFSTEFRSTLLLKQTILLTVLCFIAFEAVILFTALKLRKGLAIGNKASGYKFLKGKVNIILGLLFYLFAILLYTKNLKFVYTEGSDLSLSTPIAVVSILLFIFGSLILIAYFLSFIFKMFIALTEKIKLPTLTIGLKLIQPHMGRNLAIVIALTAVFIIVIVSSGMYSTIAFNNHQFIENQFKLDMVITDRATEPTIDQTFVNRLNEVSSIKNIAVMGENYSFLNISSESHYVRSNYVTFNELRELGLLTNSSIDPFNQIVVYEKYAQKYNLKVGDSINLSTGNLSDLSDPNKRVTYATFQIGEIIKGDTGELLIDWSNHTLGEEGRKIKTIHIGTEDPQKTIKALEGIKSLYPTMKWQLKTDAIKESDALLKARFLSMIIIMCVVYFLVSVATFNMLVSHVITKKKEYAILRTIDLNETKYLQIIVLIPMVYQLISAVLGFTIGTISIHMMSIIDSKQLAHVNSSFPLTILVTSLGIGGLLFFIVGKKLYRDKITDALKYDF